MKNPETLRLLARAATPGPWEHHRTHTPPGGGEPEVCAPGHDYVCSPSCDADGNYIAALDPPTVLALLDRLAALEVERNAALATSDERHDALSAERRRNDVARQRIATLEAALREARIDHDAGCRRHRVLCQSADEPLECVCSSDSHNARIEAALTLTHQAPQAEADGAP